MDRAAHSLLRVLVAGGGVAGLETVLCLQALAGDRVDLELLAPERTFAYRPLEVTEPFADPRVLRFPLAAIGEERNVRIHRDALGRVRLDDRVVETQGGAALPFDVLVLAVGARAVEAVPGALTFRGGQDATRVRAVVDALREGTIRRVAFVVPRGASWPLPMYELALQTAAAVDGAAPAGRISIVTGETAPLAGFGDAAAELVADMLQGHGITLSTATAVDEFAGGELWMGPRRAVFDRVIALPRLVGPHVRGIPSDPDGFVPVDDHMRVLDTDGVYAVGDVAAHGVKQGGLATQQADVAAAAIAAAAGAAVDPEPFRPVLRGLLLTGDGVRYLRHEPAGASEVSEDLLWWPPGKIAGRHLAPYLASHLDLAAVPSTRRRAYH